VGVGGGGENEENRKGERDSGEIIRTILYGQKEYELLGGKKNHCLRITPHWPSSTFPPFSPLCYVLSPSSTPFYTVPWSVWLGHHPWQRREQQYTRAVTNPTRLVNLLN
jgi:hypothetical protein